MSQVLRQRAIGILTAGMSRRAVARELNVHFSTISFLQCRFKSFGSTSNQPHNRRQCVWHCVGERFAWCRRCEQSAPWWQWGYGMGRHKLWTKTFAFYWWQFECTEIPWRDPKAHCLTITSAAITSCFSMIMHSPMAQRSVHNSWNLKISQFSHTQTFHPLSMFEMLWIAVYDSVFQYPPISRNFTAIEVE
jgi:hypothetical protein